MKFQMNILTFGLEQAGMSRASDARQRGRPLRSGIFVVMVLATLLGIALPAHACTPIINLGATQVRFPATITVPRNAAVGSIIATTTVPITGTAGTTYNDNCGVAGTNYWAINAVGVVANRVGTTSVKGIGYTSSISGGGLPGTVTMDSALSGPSLPIKSGANYFPSQVYVTVNLVVTGPVGSGALSLNPTGPGAAGVVGFFFSGNSGVSVFSVVSPSNASAIALTACTTPDVTVSLGQHNTLEFRGPGSTTAATQFNLNLSNCPAGMNNIKYEIDSVTAIVPGAGQSVVTLDAGSKASGIGVQLLDKDGNPFALGTPVPFNGYQSSTGGSYQIPLNARYFQTGPTISAGSANTEMTFLMTYQ